MTLRSLLPYLALAALAQPAAAGDWPHWRGPDRNGVSSDAKAPLRWSAGENVTWKVPLPGLSGSTPVVWGDRVFVNVARGDELELWSIDRDRGAVGWRRPLGAGNESMRKGNLSSPSPVTDGKSVWTATGTGIVAAFAVDGEPLWRRDLQAEYGKFGILHGYSSSPLLHGGTLYVQVLHGFHTDDPSYLVALDAATGATRWRVERPTDAPREAPDAYTTPALLERGGGIEIVISGADYVTGHDPATGRELWRLGGLNPSANPMQRIVASPIVVGRRIVVPSRVRPLIALEAGDVPGAAPRRLWSTERGPDVPTPAFDGTHLYILTDNGIVWCLDAATGEVVWGPERVRSASYSASPVVVGDRLYVTSEEGLTTVLAAGEDFELLAENPIGEYTLSSLAVSDGQIFLRTSDHLYCLEDQGAAESGGGSQDTGSPTAISPPATTSP